MNKSQTLHHLGQSIWMDNIDRSLIINGWFAEQITKRTFFGVTSNPSIFQKSITGGNAYALDIQTMSWSGYDARAIYEKLVIDDIRTVADLLKPIYEETAKKDGYVSIEVDPKLANDTQQTIKEAKRLWKKIGRANLMIKIPATHAGISAIKSVISEGINVNVTLIFATNRYIDVMKAYHDGLEERVKKELPISHIHSVSSFFISRMDVMIEDQITKMMASGKKISDQVQEVLGNIAIQNGLNAYSEFEKTISTDQVERLLKAGGNLQRPLWASTSTKNPDYPDDHYVNNLILPHTVNTIPLKTLNALIDHGATQVIENKPFQREFAKSMRILEGAGIDFEKVFEDLEKEGVEKFAASQSKLLKSIETERNRHISQIALSQKHIAERLEKLSEKDFVTRFYQPDARLFTENNEEKEEVLNRLGWIDAPIESASIIPSAQQLLEEIKAEGYTHALVLGMGGSSLAAEVYSEIFRHTGRTNQGLALSILDSTDPDQIKNKQSTIPLKKTLFIASSKSGTTAEMKSLVSYFWEQLKSKGAERAGNHFICITDPGTPLETFAKDHQFRAIFNADSHVGGRYSALIAFGIIPAILAGINAEELLRNASLMRKKTAVRSALKENPAFVLAAILASSYSHGIDKITIIADNDYEPFGSWLEQLIAESSGKNGKGLVPVDLEPIVPVEKYSEDRIFYYLRQTGKHDKLVESLKENGFSTVISNLENTYDISGEMYRWETTVAAFCSMIGVNPFNQPDVQTSKSLALKMIDKFKESSDHFDRDPVLNDSRYAVYGNMHVDKDDININEKLLKALIKPKKGDYIAMNAFVPRNDRNLEILNDARQRLIETYSVPVTLGFGPRFLHSTGQLHKGGKNNGIFIVLTQTHETDIDIPGEGIPFSMLEKAQALGDMQALENHNRRVMRIHFKKPIHEDVLSSLI